MSILDIGSEQSIDLL